MNPAAHFRAFVVGIGTYRFFGDLPESATDATKIADVLRNPSRGGYPPDQVRCYLNEEASRSALLDGLDWLGTNASPEGTSLFYFSGHGGSTVEQSTSLYLCPFESDVRDLAGTSIPAMLLSEKLAAINSARVVVIIDACHSGGMVDFKLPKGSEGLPQWKGGFPQKYYEKLARGSGQVVLASSMGDQESWTYPVSQQSLFTHYLLEGLDGQAAVYNDGLIHVLDLFHYVSESMRQKFPVQQPILTAENMTLNFPIALYHGGKRWHIPTLSLNLGSNKGVNELKETPLVEVRRQLESPRRNVQVEGVVALEKHITALSQADRYKLDLDLQDIETQKLEFKRLVQQIMVYGEDPGWLAHCTQLRSIFLLILSRLERLDGDED